MPKPPERILYRDVVGRVLDAATGAPVPGIPVSLLYEVALTDQSGNFRFEKVPLTHTAEVSVRVQSKSGIIIGCITLDVPVRFYPVSAESEGRFGLVIADPSEEKPVEVRIEPLPLEEVDEKCSRCHESNPCTEALTFDEVVKSGKDLRGIIVREDQIEEFKKRLMQQGLQRETYVKMRYQDTHPDGMDMERIPQLDLEEYKGRYKRPEGLRMREDKYVTCDTCHTRHVPTEQKQYVVMAYEQDNALCFQCHL